MPSVRATLEQKLPWTLIAVKRSPGTLHSNDFGVREEYRYATKEAAQEGLETTLTHTDRYLAAWVSGPTKEVSRDPDWIESATLADWPRLRLKARRQAISQSTTLRLKKRNDALKFTLEECEEINRQFKKFEANADQRIASIRSAVGGRRIRSKGGLIGTIITLENGGTQVTDRTFRQIYKLGLRVNSTGGLHLVKVTTIPKPLER